MWKVTRETAEIEAERMAERMRRADIETGLRVCPVCRGPTRIVVFGLEGNGVWVGCDETDECSRYIEIHTEGWSIEEVAAEWNKYNSGIFLVLRRAKMWFRRHFGAEKRREKRENRQKLEEKRAKEDKMREIFGVERGKKPRRWWRIWDLGKR